MPSHFAVVFDMDGVLVDTNPYHKKAIKLFCDKYGLSLTEKELIQKVYGRTNTDWITNLFGELSQEKLARYADEKETLFRELYLPHLKPVEGLMNFLESMKAAGIPLAIATSAPPANLHFIVQGLHIEAFFQTTLDETAVSHGKPNPEIYLKAAKALGFSNSQCIVIEDSLSGIAAGKSSGSKVIGITTTHAREEMIDTDLIIDHFNQITLNDLVKLIG
jgi:beta-phosphoglucomutase